MDSSKWKETLKTLISLVITLAVVFGVAYLVYIFIIKDPGKFISLVESIKVK